MENPLAPEVLKDLIKIRPDGRLFKRESTTLEFKEDFDWDVKASRVKYLKTIAAFANKQGGYIVFGVTDSPRTLKGLTKPFMQIDDAQINQYFNQFLSPTPEFEREEIEIQGKTFGFIYVHPTQKPPIVCVKDYDKIMSESSIYYRYSGQSCVIKSGDLMALLETAKQREADKWMKIFTKVATVGVSNAGIFDTSTGKLSTTKGNQFILDEKLLKRVKVLDKYSEQENGAEAVRIVGEIDKSGTIINKPFAIHDEDIINGFLNGENIPATKEYIQAMCYQSSGFMPFYYYKKLGGLTTEEMIKLIKITKTKSQAKKKILKRLDSDTGILLLNTEFPIDDTTSVRTKRLKYYQNIINNEEVEFNSSGEVKRLLEAICNLEPNQYDSAYIKNLLKEIYNRFYDSSNSSFIRKTICYIDILENE
jgi:hypothetical protein